MELSYQPKFNHFPCKPSTPVNRPCREESRCLSSSSLHPLCADRGLNIGCLPFKQSNGGQMSKRFGLPVSHLHIRRTYASAPWCSFYPGERFNDQHPDYKWHKQVKMSRCIVARSEIAGAGYPVSAEFGLGPKIRGICFYAVTASFSIFLFILMLVAHPFVLLFDKYRRKAHHLIAKIWALLTVTPFLKFEVEGIENLPSPDTPAVYVSNHQSFLDTYILLTLGRSFKFISKTAIFLFPVVGWAMFLMGLIPLKRMDSRSQLQTLKRCMDLVKKGGSVFFFPEGTRSKDGKLGVFKKGAFSIAAKSGVPVIPITLIGTGKIMPVGMEGRLNPGSVKVIIHKPIEGSNAEVLCREARNVIADALIHEG